MTYPGIASGGYFAGLPKVKTTFDDLDFWLRQRNTGLLKLVAASDTPEDLKPSAAYVCDGVSDNVEIQEAIDSLPASGGEIALLPGTYILDEDDGSGGAVFDLAGLSNVTIRGAGRDFTILEPPATRTTTIKWFHAQGPAGATAVTLSDMTLDGLQPTYAAAYAEEPIVFNDADNIRNRFIRLRITNWDAAGGVPKCQDKLGLRSYWFQCEFTNNHQEALSINSSLSVISDCVFENNGKGEGEESLVITGTTGVPGIAVINCQFLEYGALEYNSGAHKILGNYFESNLALAENGNSAMYGVGNPRGTVIAGNYVTGLGWSGFSVTGEGVVCANNTVAGTSRDGIVVNDRASVVNNSVYGCGQDADNTYSGITVGAFGLTNEAHIAGNVVRHGGGAKQHKYGLKLVASILSSGGHMIGQNDLRDSGRTASILDEADGTIWPTNEQLDYREITADQALTTTEADITGLITKPFYANATYPRQLRVRAHVLLTGASGDRGYLYLTDGSNTHLDEVTVDCDVSGDYYRATLEWQGEITADTIFKVRGAEALADAVSVEADTVHPAFIEVLQAGSDGTNAPLFVSGTLFQPDLSFPTGSVTTV